MEDAKETEGKLKGKREGDGLGWNKKKISKLMRKKVTNKDKTEERSGKERRKKRRQGNDGTGEA